MGDLLNELIIERVLRYEIELSNRWTCQTTGIGSSLGSFFPPNPRPAEIPRRLLETAYGRFHPPLQVWSTGFITYSDAEHRPLRKVVNVAAVRGELTRKRLETYLHRELNVPTGDGGLLASRLFEASIPKQYAIGLIPHFRERHEPRFRDLQARYRNSVLIDLSAEPMSVVRTIAACEVVVSTALHGLIVADSFGIPNMRAVYTNRMLGDGYKYDDYYSAFGINVRPFDLNAGGAPTVESVVEDYLISPTLVRQKQEQLIQSFTRFL